MAKGTTTLYIDDTNIRLMVTRGKRITKLADVPLEMNLSDIDTEEKEAEFAAKIKYLFKSNRISAKKIILGLSGMHCLTRPITLPQLPRTMLDEAVIREARRVLPVPTEQLYISWQTVSTSGEKIQVFMIAIPRQTADLVLRIINRAGFKPYLMDIKPLAIARLSRESTAIVVDVQAKEFDIIIVYDGLPQPIRTVPFPQESHSSRERLEIVSDELKRTVQFYNSNNPEKSLVPNTTLLVSGEMADEPELYESLAQELGFQVALLTSPLKCMKQLDPSHHLINVGLALKELNKEAGPLLPNINTLPIPYQPKQISTNKLLALPATAAAVALIILLTMTIQDAAGSIQTAQIQVDSNNLLLGKRQEQKKELVDNIAAMEEKLSSIDSSRNNLTSALNSLNNNGDMINGNLKASVNNVVSNMDLLNLGHSGTSLGISGQAKSESEVFSYVRKLTATGRFTEITISNISRIGEASDNVTNTVSFSLAVKLKAP
jgi:type IV pilus assembly protein PilM